MEHAIKKNILFHSILAVMILLGGCALHPQRSAPAQKNSDSINSPAQPHTDEPNTAPNDTDLGSSEITLSLPLPNLFMTPWSQESNSHGESSCLPVEEEESSRENDDFDATETSPEPILESAASDQINEEGSDLWERVRRGFALPNQQNVRIDREAEWFGRHQAYLDRVAERAQPYLHYIVNQVQQRGMPSEIALLPVVESAFQPYAYSAGRAAGIWQFIPDTGRRYGLKLNWWYDGRRDIVASTEAALDYLQYLHDIFDGDWLLALAAYNSGEGTVLKAMRANQRRHKPTDYWSLRLPRETEQYVPRLLALREIVGDPEQLGISLRPIADEPYLTSVKIDSQLDLSTAARLADMDLEELHQLNPGFNRWATAPDGPHRLLLPLDKAAIFATNAAELSPEDRIHWVRHRVRRGETLSHIALHYKTTVKVLTELNKLRSHVMRPGQYLIIPIADNSVIANQSESDGQNTSQASANTDDKTIYTVVSGDNLWTVARHYGVPVRQLQIWNNMKSGGTLHPGQQLVVNLNSSPNSVTAGLHMLTASEEIAKPRKITYTVRRGDSLARISQRFKVTVQQVRKWNDIRKNEHIQPGQQLTLYVPLTADSEKG